MSALITNGNYDAISHEAAEKRGLVSLTRPYTRSESGMARSVLRDMKLGGIPAALVRSPANILGAVEVYRSKEGYMDSRKVTAEVKRSN